MEDYQKDYLNKLGPRIGALEAALESLDSQDEDAAVSAQRIAHTLRGSGETYGFPGISEFAAAVEESALDQLKPRLIELIDHLGSLTTQGDKVSEKILVVDDSDEMRLILGAILGKQGYEVLKAETASRARELLDENSVSLIILDLILPDTDGRNFLMELKENFQTAAVPIVILSAKTSPQIKAECYALGANNYFEKPIDPGLLSTHVAATIQSSKKIQQESKVDNLTGLLNRAAFLDMYQNVVKDAKQNEFNLSLAVLDLDNFKSVNDNYGHSVGDDVLKYITRILVKGLQASDMIGRWGGEEFTVLFPNANAINSKEALVEVLEQLNTNLFHVAGGDQTLNVTFSAGIIDVDITLSLDENFSAADRLLYLAKESGRNRIVIKDEKVQARQTQILLAEDDDLTAEFIIHRLDRSGFNITHYFNGGEAYEAASKVSFDLVITDVKMPGMDGFELVQRIRQGTPNQNTPLIMLTSMGNENDIARGLRIGANDYMLKPFSPTELLARVHRLLK